MLVELMTAFVAVLLIVVIVQLQRLHELIKTAIAINSEPETKIRHDLTRRLTEIQSQGPRVLPLVRNYEREVRAAKKGNKDR